MDCYPDTEDHSEWSHHLLASNNAKPTYSSQTDQYSPSAVSTASSTSSDSDDSVGAPSSQSSVASSEWSGSDNEVDGTPWASRAEVSIVAYSTCNSQSPQIAAPEARQNPRRTQRLNSNRSQDGHHIVADPRPPPSLVRQSERKENFVDTLIDTTTQMIEAIWPLSPQSCRKDTPTTGKQQSLIDLRTFVHEVLKRSKTSYSTLQVALYYLILLQSCLAKHDSTMEQFEDSPACRAMQCGRRMFLAALILASKYLQDRNFSARAWGKISGLNICEINLNELAFLQAVKWKLHMPEPIFHRWTDIVLRYSPSAQSNLSPRSFWKSPRSWKAIVPTLTPELDTISLETDEDFNRPEYGVTGSKPSDMSPPLPWKSAKALPSLGQDEISAKPLNILRTLEPTPQITPINLPSLPRPAPLPTPQMTPQTGTFCTPAVSASGLGCVRSMRQVMTKVDNDSLARSTLDKANHWQVNAPKQAPLPTPVQSSLIRPISCVSSPESMVSDTSTRSSKSSRSSSISSIASSDSAMPPPRLTLAAQATQRCASKHIRNNKENRKPISNENNRLWLDFHDSKVLPPHDPYALANLGDQEFITPVMPSGKIAREAATALRDLRLNNRQPPSPPPAAIPRPRNKTKRARPNSMDLSVQFCVREQLAPRCLGDVTNMKTSNTRNAEDSIVLPDPRLADSFLIPKKENMALSSSHSNTKPALSSECLPRKRTCAGSDRGGRVEARLLTQFYQKGENCKPWPAPPLYGEVVF